MTFDIMGIKKHNEHGEYFRLNNVSWHPLWMVICRNTPELSQDDFEKGSMNDGHIISGTKHMGIIRAIEQLLNSQRRFGIDDITWDNLRAFLIFCESNDGFKIW